MSSNHWLLPLVTSSHYYDDNNLSLLNARAWLYKYGDRKLYPWLKLTPLSPMRSFSFPATAAQASWCWCPGPHL